MYQFQTTVTQDGMIPTPLPQEFLRCADFLLTQPLSEIIGDKKPIASIDELSSKEQLWENESDLLSFLDAIGRKPEQLLIS
ncbi:MAG: hypothetical protein ACRC2T_20810 [Thermoguttaceae bacterium]